MKKHSDPVDPGYDVGDLLGLGSHSARKSHYPAMLARIEELEKERNRYKWLFENALHGIFQGDLKGGFLSVNPAMAKICGYDSPDDLASRIIRLREQLFWRAHDFDRVRHELLSEGRLIAREVQLRRADGEPVTVAITLLRRPDLGVEVVEAFVADITERHIARIKLVQMNAELERRVEERTEALQKANVGLRYNITQREIVEHELTIAVAAAEEANRSKDKYLAAASHDLLQPLNAARLLVSTLQDSALPVRESRLIDQVHRALEGAEDLLADLLDISRLDQQAMQPDISWVDIRQLVEGLTDEFEPVARNARLAFRLRSQEALVQTDPRMLTRILRNLLSNAFRYTPEGRILLAMRRRGASLRIEVWDTGVGIAADKLSDIFTEFHQLLPPHSGGRQGVGLGLAIVERMARMLGYGVDVASVPGKGSRFSLSLPLERPDVLPPVYSQPVQAAPDGSLTGYRVLVIDNEPAILISMRALLERWGCHVLTATGPEKAVEICLASPHTLDAILADYHLDNSETGWDAIQAVRQALGREIPAAIITADRSDACLHSLRVQALPILNKPVKPNRLRALLASLVSVACLEASVK